MSLELERDWLADYQMWVDVNRLTCDLCGTSTPWGEPCDIGGGWDHLLGLDCCPICADGFYRNAVT